MRARKKKRVFLVMRGPNLCARSSKPDRKHSGFTTGEIPDTSEMNQITLPPPPPPDTGVDIGVMLIQSLSHERLTTNVRQTLYKCYTHVLSASDLPLLWWLVASALVPCLLDFLPMLVQSPTSPGEKREAL